MTIEIVTGTPGSGKTTFAIAERLRAEVGRSITYEAEGQVKTVTRRACVGGVNGLVVEHERLPHVLTKDGMSQRVVEYFNRVDADGEPVFKRLSGEPPLPVPAVVTIDGKEYRAGCSLFNWWMWCEPGDFIFYDEIQYEVPRGVLGRKPPPYIALLEVHRHYGVDMLFVTQHPQLLDTTIRNLVGMHRHIRSVMGSRMCVVYAWDHASNTDRLSNASKSSFLRKPEHYALFKSAAAHIAPPRVGRWVLWVVPLLILVAWFLAHRALSKHAAHEVPAPVAAAAVSAPAPSSGGGFFGLSSLSGGGSGPARSAQSTDRTWPAYVAEPIKLQREPLDGRAVQWEGSYGEGTKLMVLFGLFVDGERVATLTLAQLNAMGYRWVDKGPCVGMLQFGQVERLVTCGRKPAREVGMMAGPVAVKPAASGPAA